MGMTAAGLQGYYHYKHAIAVADCDVDFLGRLKPGAILDYFQAAATQHASLMGCGYEELLRRNIAWVIVRMSMKILKYPSIGDALCLYTLPGRPGMADAGRAYYIFDETGEAIILGSSKWCVIDVGTHRVQRLKPLFDAFDLEGFAPFSPLEGANPKLGGQDAQAGGGSEYTFTVRLTDLDRNIHMNNARYGDVILDVCGMEALKERSISRIDINFISQLFYGERFKVRKTEKDAVTYIEAQKTAGGPVFRARVQWV